MYKQEKAKCNIKEETSSIIYNLSEGKSTSALSGIFAGEIEAAIGYGNFKTTDFR